MVWSQRSLATTWNPARQLRQMQHEALRYLQVTQTPRSRPVLPLSNLYSSADDVLLRAAVPGFGSGDIELEVEGRVLTLRGKHAERTFERAYRLPFRVDSADVNAELADGLLEVRLPRAEADRPKRISISAAS